MNRIENILASQNPGLFTKLQETIKSATHLLGMYKVNFPTYTDHSIEHVREVFNLASDLLTPREIENLNTDELYVLACSCFLHDIGMCIPEDRIQEIVTEKNFQHYKTLYPESSTEEFIRNIHHELSHEFILKEWATLKIENEKYAKAIALVAQGHRKVDLSNIEVYETKFFVKNGRDFVCLPYLAAIIRIADELDVTNVRTPRLLTKYYMPNNEISVKEWKKHIATTQVNFTEDKVLYNVVCTDHSLYAALQEQFEKIQSVLNYCQKVIRGIANTEGRPFSLHLRQVYPKYDFQGFDPKGIRYSFDVQNVITSFIGDDLYEDKLVTIREALQNAIDSCRYRKSILKDNYSPHIKVCVQADKIIIEDNGMGMDEFIIENFFGRLGSSFYEQEKIKGTFEAIGQFGVGVFSYFLLGEYVDIETKTERNEALSFRIDKDPKNYFHFFGSTARTTSGTTIRIYLKNEYIGIYDISNIEMYVRDIFRFIEFPIEIFSGSENAKIDTQEFLIDYSRDLVPLFNPLKWEVAPTLKLLDVYINNEMCVGQCVIVVSQDSEQPFQSLSSCFDLNDFDIKSNRYNSSLLNFCQKGVFVASYGSVGLQGIFGNIDLKKKIKINIDRTSFSDQFTVNVIIKDFEIAILEKIYHVYFEENGLDQRVKLTENFLTNYWLSQAVYANQTSFIGKMFIFTVYNNKESFSFSIGQIVEKFESFVIVCRADEVENVSDLDLPIVIAKEGQYGSYYMLANILTKIFKLSRSIHVDEMQRGYQIMSKSSSKQTSSIKTLGDIHFGFRDSILCNSEHLMVYIWFGKNTYKSYISNSEHPFIKNGLNNISKISNPSVSYKIYKSILEYIYNGHQHQGKVSLKQINSLVGKLDGQFQYHFTQKDFIIPVND